MYEPPRAFERRCIRAGSPRSALLLGRMALPFTLRRALPARRLAALGARARLSTDCQALQPRLHARSPIGVKDAAGCGAVDQRRRSATPILRLGLVVGLADSADSRVDPRPDDAIAVASRTAQTHALRGALDVGHSLTRNRSGETSADGFSATGWKERKVGSGSRLINRRASFQPPCRRGASPLARDYSRSARLRAWNSWPASRRFSSRRSRAWRRARDGFRPDGDRRSARR